MPDLDLIKASRTGVRNVRGRVIRLPSGNRARRPNGCGDHVEPFPFHPHNPFREREERVGEGGWSLVKADAALVERPLGRAGIALGEPSSLLVRNDA
jgi:hypothetical protein